MRDKIFISYRRTDAAAIAGRLRDVLDDVFSGHVFLDVHSIAAGHDFVSVLENNLESAAVLLVVIGTSWTGGSSSGSHLGDPDDYVTLEVRTAIHSGIVLIPVLVDGATMPSEHQLPSDLRMLARSNAVEIRHSSFRRDCEPLLKALYDVLGIVPPTALERFMESMISRATIGSHRFRFDERTRAQHALFAAMGGALAILATGLFIAFSVPPDAESLVLHAAPAYLSVIGLNSKKRRRWAAGGLALLALSFGIQFAMYAIGSLEDGKRFGEPIEPVRQFP